MFGDSLKDAMSNLGRLRGDFEPLYNFVDINFVSRVLIKQNPKRTHAMISLEWDMRTVLSDKVSGTIYKVSACSYA